MPLIRSPVPHLPQYVSPGLPSFNNLILIATVTTTYLFHIILSFHVLFHEPALFYPSSSSLRFKLRQRKTTTTPTATAATISVSSLS